MYNNKEKISYRETQREENIKHFLDLLSRETWEDVLNSEENANNKYDTFIQILQYYFDTAFKLKTKVLGKNTRARTKPWLTKGLRISGKKLKELHHLQQNNAQLENYYQQYKKIYRKVLNKAKKNYNSNLLKVSNNKSKTAWNLINPNRKTNVSTTSLIVNNKQVSNPREVAEHFVAHFNDIPIQLNRDVTTATNINNQTLRFSNPRTFFFHPATEIDIIEIIKNLKNSNTIGEDNISTNILKKCAHLVVHPLVHIINCSLEEGIFPEKLKIAKITPIHKSGEISEVNNYRPISILSPFAKVYEKYVSNSLTVFFDNLQLFNNKQFGFRRGMSTGSAITDFLNNLYDSLDKGEKTLGLFLDLSKAFDLVDHKILLDKLEKYGLRGVSWQWFESYLRNRIHYVEIDNLGSNRLQCSIGVPQGSILGPLLYIIYANDFSNQNCIMYADDTSLLVTSKTVSSAVEKACAEIRNAGTWFQNNHLHLNETKTVFIRFHLSRRFLDHSLLIKTTSKSMKQVQSTKFLGINISENCSWKIQIDEICKKIAPMCYCLYQLRSTVEKSVLLIYYHAQIGSIISYGILAWGCSHECQKIFVFQKRAVRCIVGVSRRTSCKQIFRELGILTLISIYIFQLLLYVKTNNSKFETLNKNNYNTRNHLLEIPFHRLSTTEYSPKLMGIRMFNKLPDSIKNLTMNKFKFAVKRLLLAEAFYSIEEYFSACLNAYVI